LKGDIEKRRRGQEEDEKGSQNKGVEKISFPIEEDGKEEGDDHDRGSDDRNPSPCNEGIEEDARDGQTSCPFFNGDGEE
jgi:hypothetical protein